MNVAIVGSRDYPRLNDVEQFVGKLARKYPDAVVVSGGARGVDRKAETAAEAHGLDVISYRPYEYTNMYGQREWSIETVTLGERAQEIVVAKSRRISPPFFQGFSGAAFRRNGWIVDDADRFIAFWDGVSSGTGDSIAKANRVDKPRYIYRAVAA